MPCQCTAVGLQRQPQQVKVLPPPQQLQQLEIDLPLALGLLDPPPLMDPPLSLDQLPASSRTQQTALPAQMEGAGQRPAGVAEGAGLGKQQWQGRRDRKACWAYWAFPVQPQCRRPGVLRQCIIRGSSLLESMSLGE